MSSERIVSRREVVALLGGATLMIYACGDDSSPAAPLPDAVGQISNNHGHSAVISGGQLTAGGALSVSIQGTAAHTHSLELSASEVASIRGGARISKAASVFNGHEHTITFN